MALFHHTLSEMTAVEASRLSPPLLAAGLARQGRAEWAVTAGVGACLRPCHERVDGIAAAAAALPRTAADPQVFAALVDIAALQGRISAATTGAAVHARRRLEEAAGARIGRIVRAALAELVQLDHDAWLQVRSPELSEFDRLDAMIALPQGKQARAQAAEEWDLALQALGDELARLGCGAASAERIVAASRRRCQMLAQSMTETAAALLAQMAAPIDSSDDE